MAKGTTNLDGLHVLLGVSGGIAAYKAVDLASKLTAAGARVNTIMTRNACRFTGTKSFEAVTGSPVFTSLWKGPQEHKIGHLNLAEWADIIVVAPATANIIGKIANGICDDLLSTVLCACWQKPILIAPAMNGNMWSNPAVRRNIKSIRQMGFEVLGPGKGQLACGAEGVGRMLEPQEIIAATTTAIDKMKKQK